MIPLKPRNYFERKIETMIKPDWKDVGIRALKTFIQSFVGALITLFAAGDPNVFTQTAIISALAAAISAVWNGVVNPALGVPHEPPDQL